MLATQLTLERVFPGVGAVHHTFTRQLAAALAALVASLDEWLPRPPAEVLAAWRPRDALIGNPVRWEDGRKEGTAAGIDSAGALIVETANGQVTLDAGEVHLER